MIVLQRQQTLVLSDASWLLCLACGSFGSRLLLGGSWSNARGRIQAITQQVVCYDLGQSLVACVQCVRGWLLYLTYWAKLCARWRNLYRVSAQGCELKCGITVQTKQL